MSFYFEDAQLFDEFAKELNLTPRTGKFNINDPNVILRKYVEVDNPDQKFLTSLGVIKALKTKLEAQQKTIEELKAKLEDHEERINKGWDVMSDRVADLEKHFQQKID